MSDLHLLGDNNIKERNLILERFRVRELRIKYFI